MSSTVLIHLGRCRHALLSARSLSEATAMATVSSSPRRRGAVATVRSNSSVRYDPDGSGRPATWDSFGIWDNRIDEPILLPPSIRYGKPIPQVSLSRVGTASVLGRRKQNEDRLLTGRLHDNMLYFAVFDGHGGHQAAEYCHTHLETVLRDCLEEEDDLEKVLIQTFLKLDKALHTHLSYYGNASSLTAGTTATVAVLRDGVELVVGSVGDSRALLCRKGQALKLTQDHTPDRKDEKERIRQSGGLVTWNSLGQATVNGRLAMTRSIGDFHLRNSGVIALPDTRRTHVQHHHDTFLALTTDGINFLITDQEICDVINQCQDPQEAAQVISQQALQYGSEDNSSIVVVPLGSWGKQHGSQQSYSLSRTFTSCGRWA